MVGCHRRTVRPVGSRWLASGLKSMGAGGTWPPWGHRFPPNPRCIELQLGQAVGQEIAGLKKPLARRQ